MVDTLLFYLCARNWGSGGPRGRAGFMWLVTFITSVIEMKKPPAAHRIVQWAAGGSGRGERQGSSHFLPCCISESVIFQKRSPNFRFGTICLDFSCFSSENAKTPHICAVFFAVHLFYQHILSCVEKKDA